MDPDFRIGEFLVSPALNQISRNGTSARVEPKAMEAMKAYAWPGNIRELQNTIEQLKILVEGPEIRIDGARDGAAFLIRVTDNGIGFDTVQTDKIFGLFERLHGPQDYEGTGVGLAIVRLVMDKHGGRVTVESTPDRGSTFSLVFPQG